MKKTGIRVLISIIITLVFAGVVFYTMLPALNVFEEEFWIGIAMCAGCFCVSYILLSVFSGSTAFGNNKGKNPFANFNGAAVLKVGIVLTIIPVVIVGIGSFLSSEFFHAEKYSNIIEVPEAVFEEDMPETAVVSNIALMDSETAQKMGERTLGALSDVVSQYEINPTYRQINYKNAPQKVSNLEYADFFKWLSNRNNGIPGYVMVDPVNVTDANYVKLDAPIKYAESAYFGEDLHRKLRMSYPTKIFGSYSFEIDDNGNPYYIVSCMHPKVFMFGAMDVNEVIIFNPIDGTSEIYALENTPSWIDNVFTGTLASQKFDWYGTLKNGFWNSIIGNKDCKVTTDDYGYIVRDDDVWFFTGVTSVTSDESNIGFIISNARTGEYKFYPVIGAEEYSAMQAAEGEVQEKGYTASFPSLINASGEATYIMVLKDNKGIVKLYALVNVENYSIVATGSTQEEAKAKYVDLLVSKGIIAPTAQPEPEIPVETAEAEITVTEVRMATLSGESVIYILGDDGNLYRKEIAQDESLMLIGQGDKITVNYVNTDINTHIKQIVNWSVTAEEVAQ